jgi:hypothetical protein
MALGPIFIRLTRKFLTVGSACLEARKKFDLCREGYQKLAELIPVGQYYRYNDHWQYMTQRIIFMIALTIYLEAGFLVSRETVCEILGCRLQV